MKNRIEKTKEIRWKDLLFIQGSNFKELKKEQYEKLENSILKNGFVEVFKVWESGDKIYCLDGFHRCKVLKKLEKKGTEVPEYLWANFIECKDRREAAKLVMIYSSQYAKITDNGLHDFMLEQGLNILDISDIANLPDIDLEEYNAKFIEDINMNDIDLFQEEFTNLNLDPEAREFKKIDCCPNCNHDLLGFVVNQNRK